MKRAQRGAALLTAMIIVTLVAAIAAAMAWHQERAIAVEAAERARTQSRWMLLGALDWARLILREDAVSNLMRTNWDHLGEPWAVPLAEARLSTFLASQGSKAEDGPAAFLSGRIDDAQARYNLRNLIQTGKDRAQLELRTLRRLCELAGAPSGTADLIASRINAAYATEPSADAPVRIASAAELSWLGLPSEVVGALQPFVTILPAATPVNLNTAPREVIAALIEGVDLASAERLVQARRLAPLAAPQDASKYLPSGIQIPADRASVNSQFFYVTGRLRLDEHVLVQRSLLQRKGLTVATIDTATLPGSLESPSP
ncbi:MAG: type II secretion system minor pseudopilin GspK [Paucibacter sp.]|nr:type II secretion system minor pseudopilin GspK [Roseateles sp.]